MAEPVIFPRASPTGAITTAADPQEPIVETPIERDPIATDRGPETGVVSSNARDRGSIVTRAHRLIASLPSIFRELAGTAASPTREQLSQLIAEFGKLEDRAPALEALHDKPFLREVLGLFGSLGSDDLGREKATSLSRCHLAVNTESDPPAVDANEAIRLASAYAKTLGYKTLYERDGRLYGLRGETEVDLMRMPAGIEPPELVRHIGRTLNDRHFQNRMILPPDRIALDPGASEYKLEHAYWCSHLSNLAYADEAEVRAIAGAWGFDKVRFIKDPDTNTEAIVVSGAQGVFVAFRGTSNFADFKTDLRFNKTDAFGGRVHSGFNRAYQSVSSELSEAIREAAGDRPIFFTGHSLGAALAQLAAIDLADRGGHVAGVYTYGSPRVGDAEFVDHYNARLGELTFHHVNGRDIVSRVPPEMFGYRHTGHHRFTFDSDGELERAFFDPHNVLESMMPREAVDEAAIERMHDEAVAAIEAELFANRDVAPALRPDGMVLEGMIVSPASDHSNKNYLRLTCSQVRRALFES